MIRVQVQRPTVKRPSAPVPLDQRSPSGKSVHKN